MRSLVRNAPHFYDSLRLSIPEARAAWISQYKYILENFNLEDILFLHFNQLLDNAVTNLLEEKTGAVVNEGFADGNLPQTSANSEINSQRTIEIYKRLCNLANYSFKQ